MRETVNLLHEIGQLSKTPRTGFVFLGTGQQSVADHSYSVAMICFILADLCDEEINRERLLLLALCHDLVEARTGDLNYVYQRYMKSDDDKAMADLAQDVTCGDEIVEYIREFDNADSIESKLAHDADQIEMLLTLKRESDTGNPRAMVWYDIVIQRVKTPIGKKLAEEIRHTPSDEWWIADRTDSHWVHGNKHKKPHV